MRFIELMPLGGGEPAHVGALAVRADAPRRGARIEAELGPLEPLARRGPLRRVAELPLRGAGKGVVGFISPVSEPYCGTCNRMRLTADGKFHLCLLNDDEIDVKRPLRSGGGVARAAGDPA